MRRLPPSVLVREELDRLLRGPAGEGTSIISALVDTVTRLVVQQLLEAEQSDFLGGRGRYERRGDAQLGSRNGYEPGADPDRRGRLRCACSPGARRVGDLPLDPDELPGRQLRRA